MSMHHHIVPISVICLPATFALTLSAATINGYTQTNLVSDLTTVGAAHVDANLVNPWGISHSPTSPFWVSDNGMGVATLYNTSGSPLPLVVTIPLPGGGTSAPTGQVFNGTSAFGGDAFIFATEDGTIAGWRRPLGTTAETLFDHSSSGAVYKGLALASMGSDTYLYAADFHNNRIDVFPSTGAPALMGNFTDPTLPAGYAPFNVQNLGGQLYVSYAKQQAGSNDEQHGAGFGFVSVFNTDGTFVKRLASDGVLNAPWGMALTPAGWGLPEGDLLVGNFGDGMIHAFDHNGTLLGAIANAAGNPLVNDGLWGLIFGNGANGGKANSLYVTVGLNDEANGLFARIDASAVSAVPEPSTMLLMGTGMALAAWRRRTSER